MADKGRFTLVLDAEQTEFVQGALSVGSDDEESPERGYRSAQELMNVLAQCDGGCRIVVEAL